MTGGSLRTGILGIRLALRPAPLPPLLGSNPPQRAADSDEWAALAATSEWLATPASWNTLTTSLLGGEHREALSGPRRDGGADELPPFDAETLQAAARFFDEMAAHPQRLDWWRKLLPAHVYSSINSAFFAYSGVQSLERLGRAAVNSAVSTTPSHPPWSGQVQVTRRS